MNSKHEEKVPVNFRVDPSIRKKFKMTAVELEITQTELFELIFKKWERQHNKKEL